MPRPSMVAAAAALWQTLGFLAKLHSKKASITEGRYRVDLRLTGTVGGYPIDERITGTGTQSGPQAAASTHSVPQKHVVAWLWQQIPASRRVDLHEEAVAYWAEHNSLPGVTEAHEEDAGSWLKRLRATTTEQRDGAYTFAPDPDPDDLEAAEERILAAQRLAA